MVILAQNFRRLACEIDLVGARGENLYIVEVKYRRVWDASGNRLDEVLPPRKRVALRRGARLACGLFERSLGRTFSLIRLDLAVVSGDLRAPKLAYYPDAIRGDE